MATDYWMALLRWDPTDAADPPRTLEDVWGLLKEHVGSDFSISDNAWMFGSSRSWFTGVLRDLCRATGSDCPEVL